MFEGAQWLFFDIGSTLANEEEVYAHLIGQVSRQTGRPYEEVAGLVLAAYRNNENGFHETVKRLGTAKPKWEPGLERVYPDAEPVLRALHGRYKLGIIANQEPGCRERLEKMGLGKHLDLVVSSAEEGVSKPDPRLFQIALERSGCPPRKAVMLGDRIDNDIVPAKKLGMGTVWVKQGYGQYWRVRSAEETPDAEVGSLAELPELFTGPERGTGTEISLTPMTQNHPG